MTSLTSVASLIRAVALGLSLGAVAATGCTRREPAPQPAPPAPAPAARAAAVPDADKAGTFEVASAVGRVEARRDGAWVPIAEGDTLTRTDVVRTHAGGRAILRFSAGTEIELRERVEIGLDRLPRGATVDLRRGKLLARVNASDTVEITSRQTRTRNEGPARFVVLADEKGRVSVAALEGAARFSAAGKTVSVTAGFESRSQQGSAPADPERIPEEVFLDVVWPNERTTEHAEVQGRATPSTVVTVNGTPASVGADGRFSATIGLREGKNPVEVEAEDLAGHTRRDAGTIVRRPAPPALTPDTTDLWKK